MIAITTALEKINRLNKKIRIVQGGMSAGKTWAIILLLHDYATKNPDTLISVVSDTMPNIKKGVERDWLNLCKQLHYDMENRWSRSAHTYSFANGSEIEFFALDDEMKARGARRDVLFVNEANRINFDTFDQLQNRTKGFTIIDYNPSRKFWAHDMVANDDTDFLILTYRDNEALSQNEVDNIERHDRNSNWWRVYGEGLVGEVEGLVYTGWQMVESVPKNAILRRYGLDFGFSNDPTALVAVYEGADGEIYLDERLYQLNMLPSGYDAALKSAGILPETTIVCDSARPELIAEMVRAGWPAISVDKGAGSRKAGIAKVQDKKIYYTAASKNLEREFLSYSWRKRRGSGEQLDEPEDGNDHLMDALRYAISDMEKPRVEYGGVR
jgi:phage terminase large subunit